jgi:hypothetical protein
MSVLGIYETFFVGILTATVTAADTEGGRLLDTVVKPQLWLREAPETPRP